MDRLCDVGVYGLATMGANLARNAARNGFRVAVYNRHDDRTRRLIEQSGAEGEFRPAADLAGFVSSLAKPRRIIVMVAAGPPVDGVISDLEPLLEQGDILIDGGNSLFSDTGRRARALAGRGIRYLGLGVSGGEEGALNGPSMMPGGDEEAYKAVAPMFLSMAAQVDGVPCCTFIGPEGSGHYVKMVHNGIEYADMQLIAEAYDVLRSIYGLDASTIADVFAEWKAGDLDSYLIEITSTVLRQMDGDGATPLVDRIVDEASQKGTGRWTVANALELGVPLTGITEAVHARVLSSQRALRDRMADRFAGPAITQVPLDQAAMDDLRDALYASKIVAYAQGFEQMTAAAANYGWKLNLGEIATIWRGGCIIRARFLDRIREAYAREPGLPSLVLDDFFAGRLSAGESAWRRVVGMAAANGVAVPALSTSLAYFHGLRRRRGPGNLIQGLRDLFGAHTYRRVDIEGVFHTEWGSRPATELEQAAA